MLRDTVLWAAGVEASPLGRAIAGAAGAQLDRLGRLVVGPDLRLPGHPEIFVAGDLACLNEQGSDQPLRGTADVALAQGRYIGGEIRRQLDGRSVRPFKFRDRGKLAVIGRSRAVADLTLIRFSGRLAWWVWLLVHVLQLVGFQNRLTVLVQWGWSYLTRRKSARLITGAVNWPISTNPGPQETKGEDADHDS